MPIKRVLALWALLFLLPLQPASASESAASYVDLKDGPTITVDWSKATTQFVTLGGNRAFVFLNGQKGKHYTLLIKQDATGSRTVTWPSSVRWPGTQGPPLTTTAGKADYIGFIYNGVTYDALAISQNY